MAALVVARPAGSPRDIAHLKVPGTFIWRGLQREALGDHGAPVGRLVADVDGVVGPVGADADRAQRPAPEAQLALQDELAIEAQRAAPDLVVGSLRLPDAVDVDLERRVDPGRQAGDRRGHRREWLRV